MRAFHAAVDGAGTDRAILIITGDVDMMTVPIFEAAARDAMQGQPGAPLRLDLRGVGFIDSSGINSLVRMRDLAQEQGGSFELTASSRYVERVLTLVGLSDLFV